MAIMSSPWKSAPDSPSRQLLWELSRLGIASQENFYARLDRETHEREVVHKKALAAAAAEHNRIRESAELVRRELEQQVQNERRRREEEQRRELERQRQEQVEKEIEERKLLEREKAKTAALEVKRAEQAERIRKAEAETAAKAQEAEKERQKSQAAERIRKEKQNEELQRRLAQAKAVQEKPAPLVQSKDAPTVPQPQPATTVPTQSGPPQPPHTPEREAEHKRYLAVHKKLKELRVSMLAEAAKSTELKSNMGDMRRNIRKSVGQLRVGQGANKIPLQNIINTLRSSLKIASSQIPVSPYLFSPPSPSTGATTTGPSLLLYLLNIFSKAVVAQLISEAGIDTTKADPIGTIASHIFALKDFQWNEHSLIDILIAKFHVVCPVLFGIYGPENTTAGKARLGWAHSRDNRSFISLQDHSQRMAGLGAGFAALSLRNYEKAVHKNPYPVTNYWIAFANIVNVPAGQRTETHALVLKAMIEGYEERFLLFFGDAAMCALRLAIREFGKGVKDGGMGTRSLELLGDVALREKKIRI